MPLAKLKPTYASEAPVSAPPISADLAPIGGAPSPARLLQQQLAMGTATAADPFKWSPRQSVALIVTTSVAMWAAILTAATHILHALA